MQTDLIEHVIKPIGINVKQFMAKLENDPILAVLLDNLAIFERDEVYSFFIAWLFKNFELAWVGNDFIFKKYTNNKDTYLKQMIFVFTPAVHKKFYHSTKTVVSPLEVIETSLSLMGVPSKKINDIIIMVKHKYEVTLVW
jgi:hypothetical protein